MTMIDDLAIRIQRRQRGNMCRTKRLPTIIYLIQKCLKSQDIVFSSHNEDGRINSCTDEDTVISRLIHVFGSRIRTPPMRMWFDMLVEDRTYGWLPVNIKSTTTKTSDNTGNLAMCVHAYTSEQLDIDRQKTYDNGPMSAVFLSNLYLNKYNVSPKKDYYFVVLNKTDPGDVIVNSVLGLEHLTPNINNLPFQVCWEKNRHFTYAPIKKRVKKLIDCLQKPRPSWKENFMSAIRGVEICL